MHRCVCPKPTVLLTWSEPPTEPAWATGDKVWIEDVVLDSSARGKGVGKALIQFAVEYAKNQNIKSVNLTSSPERIAANELYQKLGFIKRETNVYRLTIAMLS